MENEPFLFYFIAASPKRIVTKNQLTTTRNVLATHCPRPRLIVAGISIGHKSLLRALDMTPDQVEHSLDITDDDPPRRLHPIYDLLKQWQQPGPVLILAHPGLLLKLGYKRIPPLNHLFRVLRQANCLEQPVRLDRVALHA